MVIGTKLKRFIHHFIILCSVRKSIATTSFRLDDFLIFVFFLQLGAKRCEKINGMFDISDVNQFEDNKYISILKKVKAHLGMWA